MIRKSFIECRWGFYMDVELPCFTTKNQSIKDQRSSFGWRTFLFPPAAAPATQGSLCMVSYVAAWCSSRKAIKTGYNSKVKLPACTFVFQFQIWAHDFSKIFYNGKVCRSKNMNNSCWHAICSTKYQTIYSANFPLKLFLRLWCF